MMLTFTPLARPDGAPGGFAVTGAVPDAVQLGAGQSLGNYYVSVSRSSPANGAVPEPGTLALFVLGLLPLAVMMRNGRKKS
jgi:hypothetical protein